jgi:hypothetical protein
MAGLGPGTQERRGVLQHRGAVLSAKLELSAPEQTLAMLMTTTG